MQRDRPAWGSDTVVAAVGRSGERRRQLLWARAATTSVRDGSSGGATITFVRPAICSSGTGTGTQVPCRDGESVTIDVYQVTLAILGQRRATQSPDSQTHIEVRLTRQPAAEPRSDRTCRTPSARHDALLTEAGGPDTDADRICPLRTNQITVLAPDGFEGSIRRCVVRFRPPVVIALDD